MALGAKMTNTGQAQVRPMDERPTRAPRLLRLSTAPRYTPLAENEFPQEVPVALLLIVSTVAHQRDAASSRKLLHQAERKLLAMVLDGSAALVDRAIEIQLARTEGGHQDVVPRCGQAAPANP